MNYSSKKVKAIKISVLRIKKKFSGLVYSPANIITKLSHRSINYTALKVLAEKLEDPLCVSKFIQLLAPLLALLCN